MYTALTCIRTAYASKVEHVYVYNVLLGFLISASISIMYTMSSKK
jgi:hypothetical protein